MLVLEQAYAKINLTLDVLGRRSDGYHEVDMVLQSVDLSDQIWLERLDGEDQRIVMESAATNIPLDGRNLAVAAAQVFFRKTDIHLGGVHIHLDKHIPVAAGLAGGSSDAAAVLRGLNRLYQVGLSMEDLAMLGAEVGSDVPFCVYGGCAVARGRGEQLTRVTHGLRGWVVLLKPPLFVSTADVYQALTPARYSSVPTSDAMVEALQLGDISLVERRFFNGLQPVTLEMYPEVAVLKQRMEQVCGSRVFMSGSGPTLFVLAPTQASGQRIYNAFRGFAKDVHLVRLLQAEEFH
ncbi:MAG: 4-(cytidine 5'-diphospho)-2-C-methyl-D-erythritol kinase [Alicyclobacillaceae bacterium]|nr:4-(cytidine 5'-diphospho)-2-C-methyl-D-erythritol kinase [Alicyclobacillaceae bacterium]